MGSLVNRAPSRHVWSGAWPLSCLKQCGLTPGVASSVYIPLLPSPDGVPDATNQTFQSLDNSELEQHRRVPVDPVKSLRVVEQPHARRRHLHRIRPAQQRGSVDRGARTANLAFAWIRRGRSASLAVFEASGIEALGVVRSRAGDGLKFNSGAVLRIDELAGNVHGGQVVISSHPKGLADLLALAAYKMTTAIRCSRFLLTCLHFLPGPLCACLYPPSALQCSFSFRFNISLFH